MQFIRSSALLQEARREGVVGREDRLAAMEWLKVYDEALDGRLDGGFFDFQVDGYLGMTVAHPFSLQTEKAEGLNRLLGRMFLEGTPGMTPREGLVSRVQVLPRTPPRQESSAWEIALMVLLAFNPLTYAGCSSDELDCGGCPKGLCYEGTKVLYPDASALDGGDGDAASSTDADSPQTVTGIICGCPPDSHEATCLPDEPGGRSYPCCVSEVPIDDPY